MSYNIRPWILVDDHVTDEVAEVEWEWEWEWEWKGWEMALGRKAHSAGEVYERLATRWERG